MPSTAGLTRYARRSVAVSKTSRASLAPGKNANFPDRRELLRLVFDTAALRTMERVSSRARYFRRSSASGKTDCVPVMGTATTF